MNRCTPIIILMAAARQWCWQHRDFLAQAFLVALAALMRFWRITTPHELVFDEIYFPVFANNYLHGTTFFDSHPPLGKYLIACGIRFFGFVPLGYRVMSALFGIGVIVLIYRLAVQLFNNRRVGFLAGLFAAADGVLLVESRIGLINIFAVFFCLAAYHLFLKSGEEVLPKPRWLYLTGVGLCIGAASAVKWIGAASFGIVFIIFLAAKSGHQWPCVERLLPRNPLLSRLARIPPDTFLFCCVFLPVIVYAASFSIHLQQNPNYPFFELHRQMFGYHAHLKEAHGYASPWWSWPLLLRPVNYFWKVDEATQTASTILLLGNPAVWWLAIPAVLFGVWAAFIRREFGAGFAVLAIALHYLPFMLISRASFLYHFMGALPFTIILLGYSVHRLWQAKGWRRELAAFAVAAILLCAVYFYPLWTALSIPIGAFYQRAWLLSWI
ncbi:MAG: phospholipid carrier-dependent glycosyltransferase [candidate division KSB1 bacterium]|nr:phospholipid carrier-dependent glycosyltransferase [candidate division KSB1 bacterium]MDZ7365325.1 phospholipid carrier-dependent glycosyltransferase [candidate division KSB1 bacterium]